MLRCGPHAKKRRWGIYSLLALLSSSFGLIAAADESATESSAGVDAIQAFIDVYPLGIGEHDTDEFTTVTGWRFNDAWSFGYQDGEDSGLSLVWQKSQDQMSLSHNGIRFTRRF